MNRFIQKYSDVPNGFVEDFFTIVDETYGDDELVIDFDIIVKWLKVRIDNLKRLLIHNFEEKYDYQIFFVKTKNKKGNGAHNIGKIKLTPDCFKELCMISQTLKAKEVRKYYLSIEKLVRKYHKYIEEKLNKQLGLLKTNQKPKINKKGGVIYIIKALNSDLNVYKLGRTMNIKSRLNGYNSGNANDIEPLFILEVDDINRVENCIKNLVKHFQYRKYKEVYEIDIDLLKTAIMKCDTLINGFKNEIKRDKSIKKKFKKLKKSKEILYMYIDTPSKKKTKIKKK
jgi:phage anti-repressor protein